MVIVILILSVLLAVVLLAAAILSFVEYRSRNRQRNACWLLDKQLRLEEQALDAERKMLRTYYGQQKSRKWSVPAPQNALFGKILSACSFDKITELRLCKLPEKVSYRLRQGQKSPREIH